MFFLKNICYVLYTGYCSDFDEILHELHYQYCYIEFFSINSTYRCCKKHLKTFQMLQLNSICWWPNCLQSAFEVSTSDSEFFCSRESHKLIRRGATRPVDLFEAGGSFWEQLNQRGVKRIYMERLYSLPSFQCIF